MKSSCILGKGVKGTKDEKAKKLMKKFMQFFEVCNKSVMDKSATINYHAAMSIMVKAHLYNIEGIQNQFARLNNRYDLLQNFLS